MLTVVLDTTVLRSDPARKKKAFQSLERLVEAREVTIYLPEMVIREFLSQEEHQHNKHLGSIISDINDLKRKFIPDTVNHFLEESLKQFSELQNELDDFSRERLQSWIQQNKVEVVSLSEIDIQEVVGCYFAGKHPFKNRKSREDFPDALIWQAVILVRDSEREIYFITGDKKVKDGASQWDGIIALESLDEFIKTDEVQEILRASNVEENIERITEMISDRKNEMEELTLEKLPDLSGLITDKTIESYGIPNDNQEAKIDYVYSPSKITLESEDAEYYGGGVFVIRAETILDAEISYFIYKADYLCLDDESSSSISVSDWNDHYFAAEESREINVQLTISLSLDYEVLEEENVEDEELWTAISDSSVEVDSIEDISLYFDSDD